MGKRKKEKDEFKVAHPLDDLELEEKEKELEILEEEFNQKKQGEIEKLFGKLGYDKDLSPEERYDLLKNALKPAPFERELRREELKSMTRAWILRLFFLIIVASGYLFISGKLSEYYFVIGWVLISLSIAVILLLIILLVRASNLSS